MISLAQVKHSAQEWDAVRELHFEAMAVRDVEDAVDCGILALRRWFRAMDEWHEHVSASSENYDEKEHDSLLAVEQVLRSCGIETRKRVQWAHRQGYSIDNEAEFNSLFERFESCSSEISPEFEREVLRPHFEQACRDHDRGATEEVENPWTA